ARSSRTSLALPDQQARDRQDDCTDAGKGDDDPAGQSCDLASMQRTGQIEEPIGKGARKCFASPKKFASISVNIEGRRCYPIVSGCTEADGVNPCIRIERAGRGRYLSAKLRS